MKYTLIDISNEKTLAVLDTQQPSFVDVKANLRGNALLVNNKSKTGYYLFSKKLDVCTVATPYGQLTLRLGRGELGAGEGQAASTSKAIKSSMPGKVVRLLCKEGDVVEKNQPILIIEAMKMENEIRASIAGRVTQVAVTEGKKVETGELLVKIDKT